MKQTEVLLNHLEYYGKELSDKTILQCFAQTYII